MIRRRFKIVAHIPLSAHALHSLVDTDTRARAHIHVCQRFTRFCMQTNLHVVLVRYGCSIAVHFGCWLRQFLQFLLHSVEPLQLRCSRPCLCLLACFPSRQLLKHTNDRIDKLIRGFDCGKRMPHALIGHVSKNCAYDSSDMYLCICIASCRGKRVCYRRAILCDRRIFL